MTTRPESSTSVPSRVHSHLSGSNAIQPLSLEGNLSSNWLNWYQQFKIFLRATDLDREEDSRKVAIFLHYIGKDALSIFNSFNLNIDNCSYQDLISKYEAHCMPKTNLTIERHNFLIRVQKPNESIDEFLTALKNLSLTCNLENLRESLVCDMFIVGLSAENRRIKEKLLQVEKLTLEKAIKIAKSIDITQRQAEQLTKNGESSMVNAIQKSSHLKSQKGSHGHGHTSLGKSNQNYTVEGNKWSSKSICKRCGQIHRRKCPAQNVNCNKCHKIGHFAKCCLSNKNKKHIKGIHMQHDICNSQNVSNSDENLFLMGSINKNNYQNRKLWTLDLKINNKIIQANLDTGAEANVMSLNSFKNLKDKQKICPVFVKLTSFSGNILPVIGKSSLSVVINDMSAIIEFYIVNFNCDTIIGLSTCEKLGLIKKMFQVHQLSILDEFKDVFKGLGCLPGECHITVDKNVSPVINASRKIPFALYDRLKVELNRMLDLNVIVKVDEPTEWVNSLVIIEKKNKTLRICLDPRKLNLAIKRSHYPLPTIENIRSKLSGAKYFSALDAQSGFWMIKLNESSSKLCTFGTPFGRFRFLRLPFGISCAPEKFHKTMTEFFSDIPGVLIYIDDLLIYARTIEEHNATLKEVLQRAKDINLKLNYNKCQFLLNEVRYLGHIFNEKGMHPDPKKIDAICQLAAPQCINDLKRFLGMVNYLGSYIENLSKRTNNLRQLLKKNVAFNWDTVHQDEFDVLKQLISTMPVLMHFNPKLPLTLSVDSSKFAVGAVILQNKKPIAYASKSLSDCQSRYAQIEKELYAIQFGCKRFHQYCYGRVILVETDHKPLVTLFQKPLSEVPTRLQRMMLNLQQYDLKVTYIPGKFLFIADTLSRAPVDPPDSNNSLEEELRIHMNLFISNLAVTPERLEEIKKATKADTDLQIIINYCQSGWPKSKNDVPTSIKPYFNNCHEIHNIDGLVFKNNLLIIPTELRNQILKLIHEGHLGIDRCLKRARSVVYWPNITVDIKNLVEQCQSCIKFRNTNRPEPLLPHEFIPLPWYKVGIDFFYYNKITYIIVVDYFSKYFEVMSVNSNNAKQIVIVLKSIFARHGIPAIIVSDNGPPFNSAVFKEFCKNWDINHNLCSPNYPKSNGLVERYVGVIKNLFKKCYDSNADPFIALLNYRNAQQSSGYTPAQLLMSRCLRTKLPVSKEVLKPRVIDYKKFTNFVEEKVDKMKTYYDRNSKPLPKLNIGDKVHFKKTPNSQWTPASVVQISPTPRSYIVRSSEGVDYRRNRAHIIDTPQVQQQVQPNEIQVQSSGSKRLENDNINNDNSNVDKNVTRSGRHVIKPKRFPSND